VYLSVGIFLLLLWLKQRSKTVKTAVRFSSFCPVSSSQGEPRQLHSQKVFASGSDGWSLGDLMTVYARIFGSRSKLELPVFKVMSPSKYKISRFQKEKSWRSFRHFLHVPFPDLKRLKSGPQFAAKASPGTQQAACGSILLGGDGVSKCWVNGWGWVFLHQFIHFRRLTSIYLTMQQRVVHGCSSGTVPGRSSRWIKMACNSSSGTGESGESGDLEGNQLPLSIWNQGGSGDAQVGADRLLRKLHSTGGHPDTIVCSRICWMCCVMDKIMDSSMKIT